MAKLPSKMAAWMAKQVKNRPKGYSAKEIKDEMDYIEMGRMSKKELIEIAKGKGRKASTAQLELDRRFFNKNPLPGDTDGKSSAASTKSYSKWAKERKADEVKKDKFNVGGMPAKKPVAKKPVAAKKPIARKSTGRK